VMSNEWIHGQFPVPMPSTPITQSTN